MGIPYYELSTPQPSASGRKSQVVTKGDTSASNFPFVARGIYVGGAGDVAIVHGDGTAVTWSACPVGFIIPCECIRVNSTNTTATLMTAIF